MERRRPFTSTCSARSRRIEDEAGAHQSVRYVVDANAIVAALLLTRWRKPLDKCAKTDVAEDRILRKGEELKSTRRYILALRAHREMLQRQMVKEAANDPDLVSADDQIAA